MSVNYFITILLKNNYGLFFLGGPYIKSEGPLSFVNMSFCLSPFRYNRNPFRFFFSFSYILDQEDLHNSMYLLCLYYHHDNPNSQLARKNKNLKLSTLYNSIFYFFLFLIVKSYFNKILLKC